MHSLFFGGLLFSYFHLNSKDVKILCLCSGAQLAFHSWCPPFRHWLLSISEVLPVPWRLLSAVCWGPFFFFFSLCLGAQTLKQLFVLKSVYWYCLLLLEGSLRDAVSTCWGRFCSCVQELSPSSPGQTPHSLLQFLSAICLPTPGRIFLQWFFPPGLIWEAFWPLLELMFSGSTRSLLSLSSISYSKRVLPALSSPVVPDVCSMKKDCGAEQPQRGDVALLGGSFRPHTWNFPFSFWCCMFEKPGIFHRSCDNQKHWRALLCGHVQMYTLPSDGPSSNDRNARNGGRPAV